MQCDAIQYKSWGEITWLRQLEEGRKKGERESKFSWQGHLSHCYIPIRENNVKTFIEYLLYAWYCSMPFNLYNFTAKQLLVCFQRKQSKRLGNLPNVWYTMSFIHWVLNQHS